MNDITAPPRTLRRWRFGAVAVLLLALVTGIALCESMGWPFLAVPLQHLLADALDRTVRFSADAGSDVVHPLVLRVRFLGGLRLNAAQLEIGAPAWSSTPRMLVARDVVLDLRYVDLWHAYLGQPLRIHRLQADTLDLQAERLVDGRASWQFGPGPLPNAVAARPISVPTFGILQVAAGTLRYRDAPLAIDLEARLSRLDGVLPARAQQA